MRPEEEVPISIPRPVFGILVLVAIASAILLRFLFLSSDPYPGLDWSSGLLTDESFYAHNARNLALFGRARTDEFNNMLLAPLIHLMQWGMFSVFGVGFVEARVLAVLASLLSLALFFAALNRAFGLRIAAVGALFLGLDHTALLGSRMSLLDTYAVLPSVAAFYCFVRGMESSSGRRAFWLAACGLFLAVTITNRSLCIYLLPVPVIAVWKTTTRWRDLWAIYGAVFVAGGLYFALWYSPNRVEMGHMTRYYRTVQLQPKSPLHLGQNIYHNLLGDRRGLAPYLFRHTPIVFGLALLGLISLRLRERKECSDLESGASADHVRSYLVAWLLLSWALISVIGYSPSRYYMTTYPALCALAALCVWNVARIIEWWRSPPSRFQATFVTWFVVYHAVQAVVHRGGVLERNLTLALLYGIPSMAAAALFLRHGGVGSGRLPHGARPVFAFIALWAVVNTGWMGHWLGTLRWSQVEFTSWMRRNLPAKSVVIGDVAAGLGLGHTFVAVNVIPGLCNDDKPVERIVGAPRYISILFGPWKSGYWQNRYGSYVTPESAIHKARVLKWDVALYDANANESIRPGRAKQ